MLVLLGVAMQLVHCFVLDVVANAVATSLLDFFVALSSRWQYQSCPSFSLRTTRLVNWYEGLFIELQEDLLKQPQRFTSTIGPAGLPLEKGAVASKVGS